MTAWPQPLSGQKGIDFFFMAPQSFIKHAQVHAREQTAPAALETGRVQHALRLVKGKLLLDKVGRGPGGRQAVVAASAVPDVLLVVVLGHGCQQAHPAVGGAQRRPVPSQLRG